MSEKKSGAGKTKDHIFWENEVQANKLMAVLNLITIVLFCIVWFMIKQQFFYAYGLERLDGLFLLALLVAIASTGVSYKVHFEKRWVKYLLMAMLINLLAVADVVFTYNVSILMILPMVISCRYFSTRYTMEISLVSFAVFFLSTVMGAFFGDLDLNSLELPLGTVIEIKDEPWLYDTVYAMQIPFDRMVYLKDVLHFSYLVDFMQALTVFLGCVSLSYFGNKLILRQKEMSESAARTHSELEVAANIQMAALPAEPPRNCCFELIGSMKPAKEVGGDFYDYFMVDAKHLYFVIADVSGKGVPAAMFMMEAKSILADQARMKKSPAEILNGANKALCLHNQENMFVTAWAGILETSTGKLCFASAGHEDPVIKAADGSVSFLREDHDMPLGCFDLLNYSEYERQLSPGMEMCCYTDGVTEAMNAEDKMFGAERLLAVMNAAREATAEELMEHVKKNVAAFVGEADQFDDLTLLYLKYNGSADQALASA
ncbi:MAG: serine/threonine-protein phosphatase [Lachnospiraceae bacterium]|nr:serine/threonine-protein phosphatase [Lachnospiraceae bacterium]